jgi:hypothetical protein
MSNPKTGFEMVQRKVGDLYVDSNVQRSLRDSRVKQLAASFRPDALGVLTTSYRSAKRIHVIDGQHRYCAAELAEYSGPIMTMQYYGLSIPQEAALFRLLNDTDKVSKVDAFLVSCVEKNPDSLRLAESMTRHGWHVGAGGTAASRITAIGSLERVYAKSPDAAEATLAVLAAAFGHRSAAVQGPMILGLGLVLARHTDPAPEDGPKIDVNELIKRLSNVPGGPDGIVGNARGLKITYTGDLSKQVARVIVDLYNLRKRTNALPQWV